jgi:hypothetical protein
VLTHCPRCSVARRSSAAACCSSASGRTSLSRRTDCAGKIACREVMAMDSERREAAGADSRSPQAGHEGQTEIESGDPRAENRAVCHSTALLARRWSAPSGRAASTLPMEPDRGKGEGARSRRRARPHTTPRRSCLELRSQLAVLTLRSRDDHETGAAAATTSRRSASGEVHRHGHDHGHRLAID